MLESVERFVRGISVLRLLSIATLVMIALCIVISASIALADEATPAAQPAAAEPDVEAVQPDRRMIDQSLAESEPIGCGDIYEFDFVIEVETIPNPEFSEPGNTQDI